MINPYEEQRVAMKSITKVEGSIPIINLSINICIEIKMTILFVMYA